MKTLATFNSLKRFMKSRFVLLFCPFLMVATIGYRIQSQSQQPQGGDREERFRRQSKDAETRGLAEPFKGITTDGNPISGLFPIRSTGVSTQPVRKAADSFLASLTKEQRDKTTFGVDD